MNLACLWCERKLSYRAVEGRAIPESGWMRQHIDSCARCAESSRIFGGLSLRLSGMTQSSSDGSMQKAAILERVADLPNPRRSYTAPSAAFAACAVLLVWLVSRPEQTPQLPSVASSPSTRHANQPRVVVAAIPKNIVKRPEVTKVRKAPKTRATPTKPRPRLRLRRLVMVAQAKEPLDQTTNPVPTSKPMRQQTAAATTVRWDQIGAWYEASGDHGSALAAYTRAFQDRPTPELAFTAGRAAECAGDISSAVEFYARALQPQGQSESEPKKGSATCIDARTSV